MSVDFKVNVNVEPHGKEKIDELERQIERLKSETVRINFDVDGTDGIEKAFKSMNAQMQRQAVSSGKNYQKSFNKGAKSVGTTAVDYAKERVRQQKEIEKIAKNMEKHVPEITKPTPYNKNVDKNALKEAENYHKQQLKIEEKAAREYQKIQDRFNYNSDTGKYKSNRIQMKSQLDSYRGQESTDSIKKAISALKDYDKAVEKLEKHKSGNSILSEEEYIKEFDNLSKAADKFKNSMSEVRNTMSKTLDPGVAERGANKVAAYYEENSKAVKKYGESLKLLESQFRNATTLEDKANAEKAFSSLKSRISAEGLTGKSARDEAKRAFSQIAEFTGFYGVAQNLMQEFPSKVIQSVRDYDDAMVSLRMATGVSNNQARDLMSTYSKMGKQLKATGTDVAQSSIEWMKQGKSIEESNKLAQDSIILSKIGDLSSADATKTITAAMKSYKMSESEVMSFVDSISAIDMASATDVGGLAQAFNEVAANAKEGGVESSKLLAYAAAIGETTQEGMASVGTSLNAIFSRMGNIKLSRLKDFETGEDLSNVETVLKGVGISLRDSSDEFREFDDVLAETASNWTKYSGVQKRAIAQAFAG